MTVLKSASKMVFLLMALTICAAFLYEVLTKSVQLDPKDFMMLAAMAFSFYFANKGETQTTGDAAYAGK